MPEKSPEAAIGELSMVFQELENALILLFARLTDPAHDTVGIIIASQLSFSKLTNILDALLRYRTKDTELLALGGSLLSECRQLEERRNTYIHSFYDWREISGDRITYERMKNRIKVGKGFAPDYEMLDISKMDEIIEKFRILIAGIDLYFERLQNAGIIAKYDYPDGPDV